MIKFTLRILFSVLSVIFFLLLGSFIYLNLGKVTPATEIKYGVTFSQFFAQQMGLDWRKAYLAVLDDLKVKKLRLIAY